MANVKINTRTCYYSVEVLSNKFKIDIGKFKYVLKHNTDIFINSNSFEYRNTYYINIAAFMYLLYKYRKTNEGDIDSIYKYIVLRMDNLTQLNTDILGVNLFSSELVFNTDKLLIFNDEALAGYVYLIATKDFVKIGVSSNPKVRLATIKDQKGNDCKLIYILYFDTMVYARVKERELHRKFDKYRHHGEWFTNTREVIEGLKKDYSANLV